jgi:hypothetical protein
MSSSVSPLRPDRTGPARPRVARAWRWLAVFVAVTLLHWLAAEWIERHRGVPPPVANVRVPVQVALLKPERIQREAPPPAAAPKPAPRPVHRESHAPHTLHALTPPRPHPKAPVDEPASSPAADTAASDAAASSAAADASTTAGKSAAASGNGNTPNAQAANASHGVKFSIPPSDDLQYDTFYNGVRNQPGTIHWMSDGQRYEMVVSVPLPFIGTFSWTSRGRVDAFGLAPDQYIEKRGRRPEDVTVFNRTDKQIVFTRTPASLALPDGAQDRFSMVMQLASLVRGDPGAYTPGVTREFYVADNDSGETWPVTTIGDESVQTDRGFVTARHFMRMPRREGDKRRIDVWLAPSLGWLPVRLVQTEPNGTEFELLWRGALQVPGATNDAGTRVPGGDTNQAASAAETSGAENQAQPPAAPTTQATQPASEAAPQPAPETPPQTQALPDTTAPLQTNPAAPANDAPAQP